MKTIESILAFKTNMMVEKMIMEMLIVPQVKMDKFKIRDLKEKELRNLRRLKDTSQTLSMRKSFKIVSQINQFHTK